MLQYNLKEILNARGVLKPYPYLIKIGISPFTASQIITGKLKMIKLEHMELLCRTLYCTPNDILVWDAGDATLPAKHPLTKLKRSDELSQVSEAIKTLPLDQLKKLIANNELG
jgi:DNA-binding Xre family transcriptional regulator